jgi:hypothetical protein
LEGKPQPVRQKKLAFRLAPLGALAASGKAAELRPKVCGLPAEFLKKVDGRLFDEVAFRKAPIKGRALLVGNIARAGTHCTDRSVRPIPFDAAAFRSSV